MPFVKNFKVSLRREYVCLEFICLSPHGKERLFKIYMKPMDAKAFAVRLQKAVEGQERGLGEDLGYIG